MIRLGLLGLLAICHAHAAADAGPQRLPPEWFTDFYGDETLRILESTTAVEVFRVSPDRAPPGVEVGHPNIARYFTTTSGRELSADQVRDLLKDLLDPAAYQRDACNGPCLLKDMCDCAHRPAVGLRLHGRRGDKEAVVELLVPGYLNGVGLIDSVRFGPYRVPDGAYPGEVDPIRTELLVLDAHNRLASIIRAAFPEDAELQNGEFSFESLRSTRGAAKDLDDALRGSTEPAGTVTR